MTLKHRSRRLRAARARRIKRASSIDKYLDQTVSRATLREPDLMETFYAVLKELKPASAADWYGDFSQDMMDEDFISAGDSFEELDIENVYDECRMADDNMAEIFTEHLLDLEDRLEALAPEGYYFGAHTGDGSDFGFWSDAEDQLEEAITARRARKPKFDRRLAAKRYARNRKASSKRAGDDRHISLQVDGGDRKVTLVAQNDGSFRLLGKLDHRSELTLDAENSKRMRKHLMQRPSEV